MLNSFKSLTIDKLNEVFSNYPLYSQEDIEDKKVLLEVFIPNQNIYWLLLEGNFENDDFIFFGYCKIHEAEYGYVSFNELYNLNFDIRFIYHNIPISLEKLKNKYN